MGGHKESAASGCGERPLRLSHIRHLSKRIVIGLDVLLRAHTYATDSGQDDWQFAVEVSTLHRLGITSNDLRWLVCQHYVLHGLESEKQVVGERRMSPCETFVFSDASCFVLTDTGVDLAKKLWRGQCDVCGNVETTQELDRLPSTTAVKESPEWISSQGVLRYGGVLVKQFKIPSPGQETILTAFEDQGWCRRIDNPLPYRYASPRKRRLEEAVRALNLNQRVHLVAFYLEATGKGILWEPVAASESTPI